MVLVAFLIAIAVGFILLFQNQFTVLKSSKQIRIENICINVAEKINTVYGFGVGTQQNITLPADIQNESYTITVTNQTVVCRTGEFSSIENLLTDKVRNTTANQPFEIPKRQIKILNVDGTVVIS